MRFIFLVFLLLLTNVGQARSAFPANDLYFPYYEFTGSPVTEDIFFKVIEAGQSYIDPVANRYGETVLINALWENGTVNANVGRFGEQVIINMFGGLARHPLITIEGFALVLAHEMAHAYCWNYNSNPVFITQRFRLCSEGNADYDGAHMLQWILERLKDIDLDTENYTPKMKKACTFSKHSKTLGNCIARLNGGLSVTSLLAELMGEDAPSYEERDPTVVRRTVRSYPSTVQCRLDNMWDGVFRFPYSRCWYKY